jgi:hypothetical protein
MPHAEATTGHADRASQVMGITMPMQQNYVLPTA